MSDSVSGKKRPSLAPGTRRRISRKRGVSSSEMSVHRSSAEESIKYNVSKALSVNKSSEELFEYSCDPCNTAGDHVEAQGFCTDCKEYLCGTCFKSHIRNKTSRHHNVLDKEKMPKHCVKLCEPCKTSSDEEEAAGYCTDCCEYLCSSCFRSHSRSKTSRHHVLLDIENMPDRTDSAITASFAKMNINKRHAHFLVYNEDSIYTQDIDDNTDEDEKDRFIVHIPAPN